MEIHLQAIISEIKVLGIEMKNLQYLKVKRANKWEKVSISSNSGNTHSFLPPIEATAIKMKLKDGATGFRMNLKGCITE